MPSRNNRTYWIDNLRSFITLLVVLHHAAMAYATYGYFDKELYIRSTHAIIDHSKSAGLDIFISFNDNFFMPLMFFISGLFFDSSVRKKGLSKFMRDRALRLFLPFLFVGTACTLLAYFPSFITAASSHRFDDYIDDFFFRQGWPVGPPWFVWLLFAFTLLLACFHWLLKKAGTIQKVLSTARGFCLLLLMGAALVYIPLAQHIGAYTWTGFGPFDFQLSRVGLYFIYFLLGALLNAENLNHTLLGPRSIILKKWVLPGLLGLVSFTLFIVIQRNIFPAGSLSAWNNNSNRLLENSLFILSCTCWSIFFMAVFKQYANIKTQLSASFSANAFLVYFLHFPIVVWGQFFLRFTELPALLKFMLLSVVAITLSWSISIALRKIPIVKKYL